jgi:DNA-binding NarL/FixJ family response regulator
MVMERTRILLVDNHVLFRRGVAALLAERPELEVVGEASDGLEAVARATETTPDVILMDVSMPRCSGLEAIPQLKSALPGASIVMLTVSDADDDLFGAIKAGADGYLLKDMEPEQLFACLENLRRGEVAMSPRLAGRILRQLRKPEPTQARPPAPDELTTREAEVLEQIVRGASNKEIGTTLSITENTVKIHLANILDKLHVQNRIQAAVLAVRSGMVGDEPADAGQQPGRG